MRQIEGTRYSLSPEGEVVNSLTGKGLTSHDRLGYKSIRLYDAEGVRRSYSIHRLVATTYLPNPEGKRIVNHKDGNKHNNCVSNLEWATDSENIQHAHNNNLITLRGKPVHQYTLEGVYIRTYARARQAEVDGFNRSHIIGCCHGVRKTHRKYKWSF